MKYVAVMTLYRSVVYFHEPLRTDRFKLIAFSRGVFFTSQKELIGTTQLPQGRVGQRNFIRGGTLYPYHIFSENQGSTFKLFHMTKWYTLKNTQNKYTAFVFYNLGLKKKVYNTNIMTEPS